ncbi:MAG: glycosyltransferase family 2 protein [Verrucomicrobia bacterium]|nr:glycosyltransferase family 2 protein [Verrucomicrobiota bacterium]MBV8276929.1 glycosyltransferase family 2 protein [Verrucomicrobiota bacterium]
MSPATIRQRTGCRLTILMPCLNEAETIESCVRKALGSLDKLNLTGEVVIADNGSTDGSRERAEALGARVVSVPERGYGAALQAGIVAAKGDWIVMGDADDSYDFSQVASFIGRLEEGYELVMGCRLPQGGGKIMPGAMPWKHRWLGNPGLSWLARLFFRSPITDINCGLRAFSRSAILQLYLSALGMEFAVEMVIKATLHGLRITEVPITLYKDGRSRAPHLRTWRDGWRTLRFMLLFSPRWLFLWPGSVIFLVGLAGMLLMSGGPLTLGQIHAERNSMVVSGMFILVGYQTIFFGLFTQIYSRSVGLLPEDNEFERRLKLFSLEKGILLGGALLVSGGVVLLIAIARWAAVHFGSLEGDALTPRLVIWSVVATTVGIQTIFNSFFISVLGLRSSRDVRVSAG